MGGRGAECLHRITAVRGKEGGVGGGADAYSTHLVYQVNTNQWIIKTPTALMEEKEGRERMAFHSSPLLKHSRPLKTPTSARSNTTLPNPRPWASFQSCIRVEENWATRLWVLHE